MPPECSRNQQFWDSRSNHGVDFIAHREFHFRRDSFDEVTFGNSEVKDANSTSVVEEGFNFSSTNASWGCTRLHRTSTLMGT